MLKKVLSIVLSALICAAMCVCGAAEESTQVTLYYPSYLQESEGEALVLDQMPERIVCLSNAALQILVRCGIQPVAVTEPTASVEYPDWVYDLPVISTSMSSLDTEAIIAMEPDLLIVGSYQKETYGQQFADAGIPVYYTSEGPSIAYGEAREEAITLARSFGSEELAAEIEAEFEAVEARAAAYTALHDSQTMMIFFYTPGTYFQTSEGYLGSMLSMLPFENLADTVVDPASRTLPTDIETCLTLNPDVIFYNGMISGETIAASSCYKTTNAGKAGAIYEIDPENLERQSPDLLDTLWTMGKLLYPESFVHNEPGQPWESSEASMGYIPDEEDTAEPENPDEAESQTSSEEESSSAA